MDNPPIQPPDNHDISIADLVLDTLPSVYKQSAKQPRKLSTIIEMIRTSENLQQISSQVRRATTTKEKKLYKKKLPAFIPCIFNNRPTGIIQFDYDEHNIDESARLKETLIQRVRPLAYAFISPSGGLKYGILTDYTSGNENFSMAYVQTKIFLSDIGAIKETDRYDDRMSGINYLCFFSHDPDAYFNHNPERLCIIDDVNNIVSQKENDSIYKADIKQTDISTTDEDKAIFLEALQVIANNPNKDSIRKKERIHLARAVVNEFGLYEGVQLILDTLDFFKGDIGYLESIVKTKKSITGATIISIARRFGYKKVTETFKKNNLPGDRARVRLIPKDNSSRAQRYSTEEALALIDKRVDQFLHDQINVQLIVEMGIGKTHVILKKLIEYMDSREKSGADPLRIAVFVPSHNLGNESLDKLFTYEDEQIVGDDFSLGPKRYHKVIGGYTQHCKKIKDIPEEEKKGMIRNAYECDRCEYKDTSCWYVWQFAKSDDLIRIYPSNYLYTPSELDRNYRPNFVIIDEDFSSHAITERKYTAKNGPIWGKILDFGVEGIEPSDIQQAKKFIQMKIAGAKKELKEGGAKAAQRLVSLYLELQDLNIIQDNEGIVSVYAETVHVSHKNVIQKKWLREPIIYLNGTGNKEISDAIFGENFFDITEEIRVEYNPNVTVYQLQNKSFNREQVEHYKQNLFDLVSYFYNYDNSCFISYRFFIEECLELNTEFDPNRFMYFGDTRGKKAFENNNILLVIGRHYLPHQALAVKGRLLFKRNDFDTERVECTRTIEMNDPVHDAAIRCRDFTDEQMRLLGRYYNEGEVLQAIHRLRLLHGTEQKTVIYLSSQVLDGLRVDKFIIADDILLNETRWKLVKAVQKNGFIYDKPRLIAEASGLSAKQVSNMKGKKWYQDNPFFYIEDGRLIDRFNTVLMGEVVR